MPKFHKRRIVIKKTIVKSGDQTPKKPLNTENGQQQQLDNFGD